MARIDTAKVEISLNRHVPDGGIVHATFNTPGSARVFSFGLSDNELNTIRGTLETAMSRALGDLVRNLSS